MGETILLHCAPGGGAEFAARQATHAGEDLGLVLTAIDLDREKVTGGRIEEERRYGSGAFSTFDEPVFLGSAIAQLAGHADAVVVDSLDDWARRLVQKFADEDLSIDAEIASVVSVMNARMTDLILVSRPLPGECSERDRQIHDRILERFDSTIAAIVDLQDEAEPRVVRGSLAP